MRRSLIGSAFALVLLAVPALAGLTTVSAAEAASGGKHAKRACAATHSRTTMRCFAEVLVSDATSVVPHTSSPPAGALTPSQVRSAYNLGSTSSGGRTVAIVDAYGYPNLERDLGIYRTQFGLPACTIANGCLRIINGSGGTKLPPFNAGWAGETALDVDAVSATCPDCKILVVQAKSPNIGPLGKAVNTAAAQPGVVAISNSYGGGDLADKKFGKYYNHPGIAVTASTGDDGYEGGSYPAASTYVTAVGGTTLKSASNARGWLETAWSGAGSGCSNVNTALAAAASAGTGCTKRAIADVSAAADPNNGGLAVYYPTSSTDSTWAQVGGTSESSPIIASVYALSGNTAGYANAIPYSHTGSLYDITVGANGACTPTQWCVARTGWDGPTGLGTPNGVGAF